jgi:nickel/cobalt exporter
VKRVVVAALLAIGVLLVAAPAGAHPLGNFTINTAAELRVAPDRVVVDHVVDFAEVPAFQAEDDIDAVGAQAWAAARCDEVAAAVTVEVNGAAAPLTARSSAVAFPAGQAGLSTIRLECRLETGRVDDVRTVSITDRAYEDETGWREITAVGDRTAVVAADVPTESPTDRLTSYPSGAPQVVRTAVVEVEPGGAAAPSRTDGVTSLLPRGVDGASRSFTELVSRREVTVSFVLVALLAAAALGAMHAIAPGHGKTVMAAYVVGRRGTLRQGLLIGATVAVTHTAGVLALGTGLWVSEAIAPERLIPVLGVVSGLLLAVIGAGLLRGALARRGLTPSGHHHHHHADHDHHHHEHHHHDHDHDHHHDHDHAAPPRRRTLVLLGLAGGMVPSPSALVVLLGALALGRAWLGVALVVAYGIGMALCLVGAGLLLARIGTAVEARLRGSRTGAVVFGRALPVGTASIVLVVGITVAARSLGTF